SSAGIRYVNISSVPSGARVSIDVDSVGVTPLYVHAIEASVHLLTLEKEGYERLDTLLYGQTSDTSSFLFVLRPARAAADSGLIAEASESARDIDARASEVQQREQQREQARAPRREPTREPT